MININNIKIDKESVNQRIDNFLFKKFKNIPKSKIYKNIRKGQIKINKKKITHKYKLKINDILQTTLLNKNFKKKNFLYPNTILQLKKSILYEDKYLIAINKPYGIPVHSNNKLKLGIIEILKNLQPNNSFLELVHRLDKDTSGILLIAKKMFVLRNLHNQFKKKKIKKKYIALVKGHWPKKIKKVNLPLLKYKKNGQYLMRVDNNGKKSETNFKIKKKYLNNTLLDIVPITGRTHQIRIHTFYIGHPVMFDKIYNNDKNKKNLNKISNRLFLHAESLTFIHPFTLNKLKINAPLDINLKNFLNNISKY
ncbi:Ribosomal large subunit pseudouridine synthase C [Candidatus Annandia adelgestsuga]|uniref:Pseudouridine synthase n=1 Tax=Candidatus Annandia adelgestsuga TaxID=1302411 RepID=A0A3Q9CLX4_9ENTR|nr:RluA family pseudouridine synthase [Candidatus Annandia adelgestsuga]AZP36409.1 Ribosomal large subunit pseudouridine synthase C [Candidatus Annandia adelgestsuga]